MAAPEAARRPDPWAWLGTPVVLIMQVFVFVGECAILLWEAVKRIFFPPYEIKETINQMAFIGAASVPIVTLTTFSSGAVIALYSADLLVRYGATALAGGTISLAVTREIAPVLSGIMVAARAGSAMAAQIGSMAVTEQVDALRSLNVHPVKYLVIPRLLASVVMLPILCMVGIYAGMIGGYLVAVMASHVSQGAFIQSVQQFGELRDIGMAMLKTVVFAVIVAIVACQQGLRTKEGAVGVGHATTQTVVITMVLIYVANFFLTWLMFK
jgi:phospholipid/cholesterol/gamma-HCH transport system permease protein